MPEVLPEEPSMSEVARITGVFSSPSVAFRDIAKRPRWWIPVILLSILAVISSLAYDKRIGYEQGARRILEASPQMLDMPPAQRERSVAIIATVMKVQGYGGAILFILLGVLIFAAVLKFLFDVIMGADVGFQRMMGIVSYAQLPTLIQIALTMLVMNLKPPEDFDIQNPLAFNVGAFLSSETPAWLRSLGASLDLFSLWSIALMAIGVSVASRKMTFGKALAGIVFPWALYVALKTGAAAIRG